MQHYRAVYLSNRALFPCLHSLIQTRGRLGEFETDMQTRDVVEGLHNFREFSQPPSVYSHLGAFRSTFRDQALKSYKIISILVVFASLSDVYYIFCLLKSLVDFY